MAKQWNVKIESDDPRGFQAADGSWWVPTGECRHAHHEQAITDSNFPLSRAVSTNYPVIILRRSESPMERIEQLSNNASLDPRRMNDALREIHAIVFRLLGKPIWEKVAAIGRQHAAAVCEPAPDQPAEPEPEVAETAWQLVERELSEIVSYWGVMYFRREKVDKVRIFAREQIALQPRAARTAELVKAVCRYFGEWKESALEDRTVPTNRVLGAVSYLWLHERGQEQGR